MLDAIGDYYIVMDTKASREHLCIKRDGVLFMFGCFGEVPVIGFDERTIIHANNVILPVEDNMHGWKLCGDELPLSYEANTCSVDVLTYDSRRNKICECCWDPFMLEWVDSESMGPYDKMTYYPDYWFPLNERPS